jgi:hypothetical protein
MPKRLNVANHARRQAKREHALRVAEATAERARSLSIAEAVGLDVLAEDIKVRPVEDYFEFFEPDIPPPWSCHPIDGHIMDALNEVAKIADVPETLQWACCKSLLDGLYFFGYYKRLRPKISTDDRPRRPGRPRGFGKYWWFELILWQLFTQTWQHDGHLTFNDKYDDGKSGVARAVAVLRPVLPSEWIPDKIPIDVVAKVRKGILIRLPSSRRLGGYLPPAEFQRRLIKEEIRKREKAVRRKLRRSGIHTG